MKTETATKQAYETPELSLFGTVEDLTQGGTAGAVGDGTTST
ncbi:MAG: lasso RiPP family leader peptide-containing protein [Verrucomicrobia bacterium]|nr:lasso RiPP family leader peptide-containing protein [Verrucomicrobiota bacterium]NBU09138.1 lasso RiPP family leader peptide-containing protein [Pseudomonadota bacterium]NDB77017.1 lasso RiPP family leader peptide-containing protein [Verrucomicrobiota bacterium]NDD40015.1 lasso RiPP family leader peptide-containing protein [Verrucomicrobiota bacterium]